ncbi:MAG: ribose ABC transporter substrate-binding protein, partial [Butyricicoccus sp.]|nr:ribose ABC transporter substrate-binding protein [Butyricicoccus sp.]
MTKKIIAMLLAGVMCLSLAACGGSDAAASAPAASAPAASAPAAEDQLHFSVILKTTASEHWQLVMAGCKQFEKENPNITIDVTGPASETSYDDQQNMI